MREDTYADADLPVIIARAACPGQAASFLGWRGWGAGGREGDGQERRREEEGELHVGDSVVR